MILQVSISSKSEMHVALFCGFQIEVTFNFLEIRAMNTYPEHQVKLEVNFFCCCLDLHSCRKCLCTVVSIAGRHRYRQDHLLIAPADTGPVGSHGRPHQLRSLSSLQQLHLCVSISEQPQEKKLVLHFYSIVCVYVLCWPTLTALDTVLASWQLHFRAAFLFSSQKHCCIPAVCLQPISMSR